VSKTAGLNAQPDSLRRFLFESEQIRGSIVRLDTTWQKIQARDDYPAPIQTLLGEALAATALLGRNLKFDGRLTLQLQGGEHLRLLVLQCDTQLRMRGLARFGEKVPDTFADLVAGAALSVTVEATRKNQRYQSIVPLDGANLADSLEHYYRQSVQLPSLFLLAADDQQAAGIMLQALPERQSGNGRWQRLADELVDLDVARMCSIDDQTLLTALFPEDDIRLFDAEPVEFHCDCSAERIQKMFCMLDQKELATLVGEHDPVEVRCEFCNHLYAVPGDVILRLAAEMRGANDSVIH
jgi:molecular chaperone Hsp33